MLCKKTNFSFLSISFLLSQMFLFFSIQAQQNPGITFYNFNSSYSNPATVGLNGESFVQLHYRNQWTQYQSSYDGSGNLGTQIATISLGVDDLHLGGGLQYMNDLTPSGVGLQFMRSQFAYHYAIGDGVLSAGAQIGISTKSFDGRVFRLRDPNDPLVNEFTGKSIAKSSFDLGLGLLYSRDRWSVGAYLDHLNSPSFAFSSSAGQSSLLPMLTVIGSANFEISEQIVFNPFTQVRSYQGQYVGDLGMRIHFAKLFWLGGNYRTDDALSGMFGFSIWKKQIDFAYALDRTISNQSIKAPISHEFFVRFNLPNFKLRKNIALPINTPRFKIN
ncbi:MAG: hypothetical protein RJA76_1517 [Bacteroidota bacterium]|jgi:type IX secretion system PorP/SprF family membrane protein